MKSLEIRIFYRTNPKTRLLPFSTFWRGFSCRTLRHKFKQMGGVGFGHRRAEGLGRRLQCAHRQLKKKGDVGSGYRRAQGSGGAFRARLGDGSHCPLASPPAHEEVKRRPWASPGQSLGRRLHSLIAGQLV